METGANYGEVLANAQRAGYAEADPSADVDGFDARAKLCILARLALQAEIRSRRGSHADDQARWRGGLSLCEGAGLHDPPGLARADLTASLVRARVGPMLVPKTSPIAWSHGTQNMIVTSGEFGGDVVFSGHGAGGHPTAVAVVSDVLAVAQRQLRRAAARSKAAGDRRCDRAALSAPRRRRQSRNRCGDRWRVGEAADQHRLHPAARGHAIDRLPFVVTTEPCLRSTLDRAVAEMASMDFMLEPPLVLEILVEEDRRPD